MSIAYVSRVLKTNTTGYLNVKNDSLKVDNILFYRLILLGYFIQQLQKCYRY